MRCSEEEVLDGGGFEEEETASTLAQALDVRPSLTSLDLAEQKLGDDGVAALVDALMRDDVECRVSTVNLGANELGEAGAALRQHWTGSTATCSKP